MPGKEHMSITSDAVESQPRWIIDAMGNEVENLIRVYSKYPDTYFDIKGPGHAEASPYYFETDGVQFHYLPDTPIVEKYRFWRINSEEKKLELPAQPENLNWKHARDGFRFYLHKSVEALRANKTQDALSFMGWLLHMLQDSSFLLHSLEGPYGTDLFVLDRLFPEVDEVERLPSMMLAQSMPDSITLDSTPTPTLLGENIEEAVFKLYSRYVKTTLAARRITFQIALAKYNDVKSNLDELYKEMYYNATVLCADVIFTIFSVAMNQISQSYNSSVYLSDLEPIERPWGCPGPYRFKTMLKNRSLDLDRQIVPLRLHFIGSFETYEKGLGIGTHSELSLVYEIPKSVYSLFTCDIGLQAECVDKGEATISFFNDEKLVFEQLFNSHHSASKVRIENPGGRFEVRISSPEHKRTTTLITWGCPKLTK